MADLLHLCLFLGMYRDVQYTIFLLALAILSTRLNEADIQTTTINKISYPKCHCMTSAKQDGCKILV